MKQVQDLLRIRSQVVDLQWDRQDLKEEHHHSDAIPQDPGSSRIGKAFRRRGWGEEEKTGRCFVILEGILGGFSPQGRPIGPRSDAFGTESPQVRPILGLSRTAGVWRTWVVRPWTSLIVVQERSQSNAAIGPLAPALTPDSLDSLQVDLFPPVPQPWIHLAPAR